jgi:small subunit ribosomal protein S20
MFGETPSVRPVQRERIIARKAQTLAHAQWQKGILQKCPFGVEYRPHLSDCVQHSGRSKLANTKSALKEIRKTERRRQRNRLVRASTRTLTKNATRAIQAGDADMTQTLKEAIRALDKAAQKGVIHKNAAARRKSRLMKKLRARAPQS